MPIDELLNRIRATEGCEVWPPNGQPQVLPHHRLPADLSHFYQLCGGLVLFPDGCTFGILPAEKVGLATPLIRCIAWSDREENEPNDISWDWYVVAHDGNGDYFSIDLAPTRLGRCYDSFHETYAQAGDTPILAYSFGDFLERMFTLVKNAHTKGQYWENQLDTLKVGDGYET